MMPNSRWVGERMGDVGGEEEVEEKMRERDQGEEEDYGEDDNDNDNEDEDGNDSDDDEDENKYDDADDEQEEEEEPPASASAPPAPNRLPDLFLRVDRAYCEWRARINNNSRPLSSSSSSSFTSQLSSPPLPLSPLSLLSLCARWTSSPITDSPQRKCPRHRPPQMKCPVHQHYRRERGREREEVVERSGGDAVDGGRITEAVVEMMICNEINKLHCKVYRHSGDADGGDNVVNKSKFVVECEDGDNHAKFAFGDTCLYNECDRQSANFVLPRHPSLYSEVCANASPSLSRSACLTPIIFWMVYLQAVMLEMVHRKERKFKAREGGTMNANYNMPSGHWMWLMHYMSLLLYSDFTEFQREFKKFTRRGTERETVEEFYNRNAFVAHWNRYLYESVTFFGTQMKKKETFYCGISIPMLFNSMEQRIICPLSTTSSYNVALRFAGNQKGVLLVIQRADQNTFYFPLHLFSQFDYEEECFFCDQKLKIVDIRSPSPTSGKLASCFPAVTAIRLMEMVLRGQLFMDCNERMARKAVEGMVGWMEAYEDGMEYEEDGDGNEDADHKYCQMLFNHRIKQFTETQNPDI